MLEENKFVERLKRVIAKNTIIFSNFITYRYSPHTILCYFVKKDPFESVKEYWKKTKKKSDLFCKIFLDTFTV